LERKPLKNTDEGSPLPVSKLLGQILREQGSERLTFSDLAIRLRYRAWGGLLLIFATINVFPLPPGATTLTAIPLLLLSAQLALGRATPWFPGHLDRRGLRKDEVKRLVARIGKWELKLERIFKPRLVQLTGRRAARVIGAVCFCLSLIVALPIPLLHHAPAATIALFGLALIYRDGALVIVAAVAAVLSLALAVFLIGTGWAALSYLATNLRGWWSQG
jgi:hypothetical protein